MSDDYIIYQRQQKIAAWTKVNNYMSYRYVPSYLMVPIRIMNPKQLLTILDIHFILPNQVNDDTLVLEKYMDPKKSTKQPKRMGGF